MLKLKLVSSQVKAFLDDSIDSFKSLEKISACPALEKDLSMSFEACGKCWNREMPQK